MTALHLWIKCVVTYVGRDYPSALIIGMGFYQTVAQQYGIETVVLFKKWGNTNIKLAASRNRKIFLLNCRRLGIVPTHITNNTQNVENLIDIHDGRTGQEIHNFNNRLKNKILNLEIKITHGNLTKLERSINQLQIQLENKVPNNMLTEFIRRQTIKYNIEFHKIKNTNINKLKNLEQQSLTDIKPYPPDIMTFLSLGAKFCLPPKVQDVPIKQFLADVENLISSFNDEKQNIFRAQITNILTNFIHKPSKRNSYLNYLFIKTNKFLHEHPELIVTKSDKGNVTVLLTKDTYDQKSLDILNDQNSYNILQRDPTSTLQQKANKLVHKLEEKEMITEREAKNLKIYNAVTAKFYGLPKIHKPTLSLRPIISSIDTPNSKIAQFATNILTWSYDNDNEYYIKDSFQFAEFINDKTLPPDHVIISLDVVSLFSNIPLTLVKESIHKRWDTIKLFCNMDLEHFDLIIDFIFDIIYYFIKICNCNEN
ncbi:hypothetical protein NQ317_002470 [Molorchus minor]|uniref:Reverse transcriptase domain-containing protein n=1 Tax=Molorchus minor TaxID=1323400 RepID=A0ABQ9JGS4_9CUCU|nr:hypothetical protein NQ317_002470 [Molorchus minor]